MRPLPALLIASAFAVTASCAFLLDFDGLKGDATDASVTGGSGTGASGGSEASTGGAAGGGGVAGGGGTAGGAAGSDAGTGIPLSQLGDALATALCENLDSCYESLVEIATQGNDCTTYFGSVLKDSFIALLTSSVDGGTLGYDPVKAAACVSALNPSQGCVDPGKAAEQCKKALSGLKANGSSCTHTFECMENSFCDASSGCANAVCKSYGQANDPCVTTDQCAEGYTCYQPQVDAGVASCQPYSNQGDNCEKAPECEPGTFCVNKVCQTIAGLFVGNPGATCYSNNLLCKAGNSCEFTGIPIFSPAACVKDEAHPSCGVAVPDSCGPGAFCNGLGTCTTLPGDGIQCANSFEQWFGLAPKCAKGLACVNKTCRPIARLDESCFGNEQCASFYCEGGDPDAGAATGTCKPPACVQ
jgi:Dickkopf N-terminal cysteine-rich region